MQFKKISYLLVAAVFLLFSTGAIAASVPTTATGTLGADQWYVASDGTLTPTESTYGISLGGSTKTSWGSVTTPMTDQSTYVNTTDGGTMIRLYDAGYFQAGDGSTDSDVYIKFDGADDDWAAGIDTTTDDYTICLGGTFATDNRLTIKDDTGDTVVTLGDGVTSVDTYLIWDGNAEDFFIALDDGTDNLRIGVGTDVDLEPILDMDATTYALLTYGDITMGGTTPVLTVGDAGAEDTQIVFAGNAQDYYIALDDATTYADDFCIGLGTVVGTTVAMSINESLVTAFHANVGIDGTTPTLTVGDGDDEDNMVVFSGGHDYTVGVDDTREEFEITVGLDVDQTCALSIDSSSDVTFDTGDVDIADGSLTITIDETTLPLLLVENTNADATCGIIRIEKDSASPADDDDIGRISFYSDDSGGASSEFAYILAEAQDITAATECGSIEVSMEIADTDTSFVMLQGAPGAGTTGSIDINMDAADIDLIYDGNTTAGMITVDATLESILMQSSVTLMPALSLTNTNADANSASLNFRKDGEGEADSDVIGLINFYGNDSANNDQVFGYIKASCTEVDTTDEAGSLEISLEVNDTDTNFVTFFGDTGDVDTGHIEFNQDTADIDFHIDGANVTDLLLVDASTDTIAVKSTFQFQTSIFATGYYTGTSSMASAISGLGTNQSLAYGIFVKDAPNGTTGGTLVDGTVGQMITFMVTGTVAGDGMLITPVTTTGFTSFNLDTTLDSITLLFLDATRGWIIVGNNGATIA